MDKRDKRQNQKQDAEFLTMVGFVGILICWMFLLIAKI